MPDEKQVQAPVATDTNPTPPTADPLWRLLFDRLDTQDENIKRAVDNTVVLAAKHDQLKGHVNDEQRNIIELIETKVGHGEVLNDLWRAFLKSRPAQLVVAGVSIAMAPVVIANWGTLVENLRGIF